MVEYLAEWTARHLYEINVLAVSGLRGEVERIQSRAVAQCTPYVEKLIGLDAD